MFLPDEDPDSEGHDEKACESGANMAQARTKTTFDYTFDGRDGDVDDFLARVAARRAVVDSQGDAWRAARSEDDGPDPASVHEWVAAQLREIDALLRAATKTAVLVGTAEDANGAVADAVKGALELDRPLPVVASICPKNGPLGVSTAVTGRNWRRACRGAGVDPGAIAYMTVDLEVSSPHRRMACPSACPSCMPQLMKLASPLTNYGLATALQCPCKAPGNPGSRFAVATMSANGRRAHAAVVDLFDAILAAAVPKGVVYLPMGVIAERALRRWRAEIQGDGTQTRPEPTILPRVYHAGWWGAFLGGGRQDATEATRGERARLVATKLHALFSHADLPTRGLDAVTAELGEIRGTLPGATSRGRAPRAFKPFPSLKHAPAGHAQEDA